MPSRALRPRPADPFTGRSWTLLAAVTDTAMLWIAFALATAWVPLGHAGVTTVVLAVVLVGGTVANLALRGTYDGRSEHQAPLDAAAHIGRAVLTGTVLALAAGMLLVADARTGETLAAAAAMGALLLGVGRCALLLARRHARLEGRSARIAVILGAGRVGAELERRLLADPGLGVRPVGFLDDDPGAAFWDANPTGPVLGRFADAEEILRETGAQQLIVAFSAARDEEILPVLRTAQALGIDVSLVPRLFEESSPRQQVISQLGTPAGAGTGGLVLLDLRAVRPQSLPVAIKHGVGRVVAASVAVALSPMLAAIALAVRASSPGPILYRQRRVGRDGQVFEILKFRTMRQAPSPDARHLIAVGCGPGGVEGVDRRTRVGTFLRRSSLDELPQLFNVIFGHMSLVGPRPERPEFVAMFGEQVRGYADRHRVKSGMTGWAQVHGLRGQTSIADRIEMDNWYVVNWSLWLDLKIILMTPREILRSRAEAATAAAVPASAVGAEVTPLRPRTPARAIHGVSARG